MINGIADFLEWLQEFLTNRALQLERFGFEQAQGFWRATLFALVVPAVSILLGAIAGMWSWTAKAYIISGSILLVALPAVVLGSIRHALALELASAAAKAYKEVEQRPGLSKLYGVLSAPVNGALGALNAVFAVLYSEIVIGMVAIALPVHENPGATAALAFVGTGLAVMGAQTIGANTHIWRRFAVVFLAATAICTLALIIFPSLGGWAETKREELNRSIRGAQQRVQSRSAQADARQGIAKHSPLPPGQLFELPAGAKRMLYLNGSGAEFWSGKFRLGSPAELLTEFPDRNLRQKEVLAKKLYDISEYRNRTGRPLWYCNRERPFVLQITALSAVRLWTKPLSAQGECPAAE